VEDLTDEQLMVMFRYGNTDAFDCLYMRYSGRLYTLLTRMLKNASTAEDVLQEVFVKVAGAAKSYRPTGRFRTWIYRIAVNHALNVAGSVEHRTHAKVIRLHGVDEATDETSPIERLAAPGIGPAEALGETEFIEAVTRELDDLPANWRAVFLLVQVEGLEYEEAAEALDMPVGTVRSSLHRARARLAIRLSRHEPQARMSS
jgi:RNA polymerase sigma-70 factor (ECF subfamily)